MKIIFDGTAKLNENGKQDTIWADGKLYKSLNENDCVLKREQGFADFPDNPPFEKSSDLWGITIYETADVNYFTFEIA